MAKNNKLIISLAQYYNYILFMVLVIVLNAFVVFGVLKLTKNSTYQTRAASAVTLSVGPPNISVQPNNQFSVNILIEAGTISTSGVDLVLKYDQTYINFVSLLPGINNFYTLAGVSGSPDILSSTDTSTPGIAKISIGTGPSNIGKIGSGILATVVFSAKNQLGQSYINIDPTTLIGALNSTSSDIIINNGVVSVSAVATIMPTIKPTIVPTKVPTEVPTILPSIKPTVAPTKIPTTKPTSTPTKIITTDTTAPSVTIFYPNNNSKLDSDNEISVYSRSSDNIKVTKIEYYINGILKCGINNPSKTTNCKSTVARVPNAVYPILVKVFDAANNTNSATVSVYASH